MKTKSNRTVYIAYRTAEIGLLFGGIILNQRVEGHLGIIMILAGIAVGVFFRRVLKFNYGFSPADSMSQAVRLMFPPMFKWIGFAMAAAGGVLLITLKHDWLWSVALLGLWVATLSRDRREDELVSRVRLTAGWSMLCALPVAGMLSNLAYIKMSFEFWIFLIMCFYHLTFITLKANIRREEHN